MRWTLFFKLLEDLINTAANRLQYSYVWETVDSCHADTFFTAYELMKNLTEWTSTNFYTKTWRLNETFMLSH